MNSASDPTAPSPDRLQKTFGPARVLSGFMDQAHLDAFLGEYLATLDSGRRAQFDEAVRVSRIHAAKLPPIPLDGAVVRPLTGPRVDRIVRDPLFQQSFSGRPFQFSWVRIDRLIALQVHVTTKANRIPVTKGKLLEVALPTHWEVPTELSFTPPAGPIQIVSSNPAMQGLQIGVDHATGHLTLSAAKHINLIKVVSFQNRYFLHNGYHRVVDLLSSGVAQIPAIVTEAFQPEDLRMAGASFAPAYVMGRPRPPMVFDFMGQAAVEGQLRERRYGVSVKLEVHAFNVGV